MQTAGGMTSHKWQSCRQSARHEPGEWTKLDFAEVSIAFGKWDEVLGSLSGIGPVGGARESNDRSPAVCAVPQAWGPDTSGPSHQLFDSWRAD
jgi:hypothetical protein